MKNRFRAERHRTKMLSTTNLRRRTIPLLVSVFSALGALACVKHMSPRGRTDLPGSSLAKSFTCEVFAILPCLNDAARIGLTIARTPIQLRYTSERATNPD